MRERLFRMRAALESRHRGDVQRKRPLTFLIGWSRRSDTSARHDNKSADKRAAHVPALAHVVQSEGLHLTLASPAIASPRRETASRSWSSVRYGAGPRRSVVPRLSAATPRARSPSHNADALDDLIARNPARRSGCGT